MGGAASQSLHLHTYPSSADVNGLHKKVEINGWCPPIPTTKRTIQGFQAFFLDEVLFVFRPNILNIKIFKYTNCNHNSVYIAIRRWGTLVNERRKVFTSLLLPLPTVTL